MQLDAPQTNPERPIPESMLRDPPTTPQQRIELATNIIAAQLDTIRERTIGGPSSVRNAARHLERREVQLEENSISYKIAKFLCLTGTMTGLAIAANHVSLAAAAVGGAGIGMVISNSLFLSRKVHPLFTRYERPS